MPVTLSDITKGLESAVASVSGKKARLDEAKKVAAAAEADYLASLDAVRSYHAQYSDFMKNILSGFGQMHVQS